ncbi:MAG: hypothetical protein AB7F28_03405 [Candidatus Margulisiibacteriota bacterium]
MHKKYIPLKKTLNEVPGFGSPLYLSFDWSYFLRNFNGDEKTKAFQNFSEIDHPFVLQQVTPQLIAFMQADTTTQAQKETLANTPTVQALLKQYVMSKQADPANRFVALLNALPSTTAQTLIDGLFRYCDLGQEQRGFLQRLATVTQEGVWEHIAAKVVQFMDDKGTPSLQRQVLAQNQMVQALLAVYSNNCVSAA